MLIGVVYVVWQGLNYFCWASSSGCWPSPPGPLSRGEGEARASKSLGNDSFDSRSVSRASGIEAKIFDEALGRGYTPSPRERGPGGEGRVARVISILIPFRNEASNLPDLLSDLRGQDCPRDRYEIIFINDHSTDGGDRFLAGVSGVKLLHLADHPDLATTKAHKKAALSLAIARSTADIIVTTDADCRWPPNVLSALAAEFADGADVVLGPVFISPVDNFCAGFQALDLAAYQFLTRACVAAGTPALANGAHFAFRREVFAEVGGYTGVDHLPSGDDVLLLHKFVNHRRPLKFAYVRTPSALITTHPVVGWRALWLQRLRWAGKAGEYASPVLARAQVLSFLTALAIVVGLVWGVFDVRFLYGALVAWGLKAAVDGVLLRIVTAHYGRGRDMRWYFLVQLGYPFYLVGVGVAALLGVEAGWKGRGTGRG